MEKKSARGYPLQEAILRYSTPSHKEALASLSAAYPKPYKGMSREAAGKMLFSTLQTGAELLSAYSSIRGDMGRRLCAQLQSGRLLATGVQTLPVLASGRSEIPAFLFDNPKLQLAENSLENFGYRFEAIRIARAPKADVSQTTSRQVAPQNRAGRPSREAEIDAAIQRLTAREIRVERLPRKHAYKLIRDEVIATNPGQKRGLTDPVLQRVLYRRHGRRI